MIKLDGLQVSNALIKNLKIKNEQLKARDIISKLTVVSVGNDDASSIYIRNKARRAAEIGIEFEGIILPEETQMSDLKEVIEELNCDENVNGVLIQLPLPKHLDDRKVLDLIIPEKDVDGFHPQNVGRLWNGELDEASCTPLGIIAMLDYYKIPIRGENVIVVGRSNIVGKPMASLFLGRNATVTMAHSKTTDLKEKMHGANIVVTAIGKPKFFDRTYFNENAVVIDVGMNRDINGKLCGDVDYEDVSNHVKAITPVPGGVGPMTIAMLLKKTLNRAERKYE